MDKFVAQSLFMFSSYQITEEEMCIEFKKRADEAVQKYWDARKYPRKTKKRMRKEANADYVLYKYLSKPVIFEF